MAFRCGFFNSVDGDRVYTADEMNRPYRRLVSNGVFALPSGQSSTDFQVLANNNMTVTVKAGEGIFFDKWSELDADMLLNVSVPHTAYPRIDSIVVKIDNSTGVRAGSIEYLVGTPASNPVAPTLTRTNNVYMYRLANIRVNANVGSITQENITDTRAGAECGFVTHLLQQADISATYLQWQTQFDTWFEHLRETVSTATLITSFSSLYVTSQQDETVIPIQISRYAIETDILQVFINGIRLIPDVDYTIDSFEQITLTKSVDINTPVAFVVYKSVNGEGITETVIEQVNRLFELVPTSATGGAKVTVQASGNVLDTFMGLDAGVHTLYAPSSATGQPVSGSAFRYFGHLTVARGDTSIGWLMAWKSDGKLYNNFLNAGTWSGWKEITNSTQITADNGGVKIEVASGESVLTAFQNAGTGFTRCILPAVHWTHQQNMFSVISDI